MLAIGLAAPGYMLRGRAGPTSSFQRPKRSSVETEIQLRLRFSGTADEKKD